MNTLEILIKNCYGIKELEHTFDFHLGSAFAVYAPNGSMKSSLAQTFQDIAANTKSGDRIFPNRKSSREITIDGGNEIPSENIYVIRPYHDEESKQHGDETSTLLVNAKLRKEYEDLHVQINERKALFLAELKKQSGSKKDIEGEVSSTFTQSENELFVALIRIENELKAQENAPFAEVPYDVIFDDRVQQFLQTKDFGVAIEDYIRKYNELLDASQYFKKGVFNYYNAETIAKNLASNGFFDAKHSVNLNADTKKEIASQAELVEVISQEKQQILKDEELRKRWSAIEGPLHKNVALRAFEEFLSENEWILAYFTNIGKLKELIWKSYIRTHFDLYMSLLDSYRAAEKRKKEIEKAASAEKTQWEEVIEIFNSRFFVPFQLVANNKISVILGQEPILNLGFVFRDGEDEAPIARDNLLRVLSTGEKRAFYMLNILFDIEVRKKLSQETLFVIDDIADSFDYKNKYAIIQYLKDISEQPAFYQLVLTHNFDFFRTVNSRFIKYQNCLMGSRRETKVALSQAFGIKNIFVNDWKPNFFTNPKKKVASIPFVRNIIEYTKGTEDPDHITLTSMLHWRPATDSISISELDKVFTATFGTSGTTDAEDRPVFEIIFDEAKACLNSGDGISLENKVVLSIAIRLTAEQFMASKINDEDFVKNIESNQSATLLAKYEALFPTDSQNIETLKNVILMTPENIHLNSFMYEPILDMSGDHLERLYQQVLAISEVNQKSS